MVLDQPRKKSGFLLLGWIDFEEVGLITGRPAKNSVSQVFVTVLGVAAGIEPDFSCFAAAKEKETCFEIE